MPPLIKGTKTILALGAESAGNFSVFFNPPTPFLKRGAEKSPPSKGGRGGLYFSQNFGDLLDDKNFVKFQKFVLDFLKKNKIKPDIILTDLHPEYRTTLWGEKLSKKFSAEHIKVQHHHAHIFSAIGEQYLQTTNYKLQANTIGIALDGTGYGLDGKIWGGEVFGCRMSDVGCRIKRVGHLENQIMIGGDLAVKEPARMLISILSNLKTKKQTDTPILQSMGVSVDNEERVANGQNGNTCISESMQVFQNKVDKEYIYEFVKRYYSRNQFEMLYNQLQQNFNCVETSSAGRVLDAVSILLGFCGNKRNYKHEPIDLLEKNSSLPYRISSKLKMQNSKLILETMPLFEYLIKNLHKDKKRLAATAQIYIAEGLYEIAKKQKSEKAKKQKIFLAGGLGNNKIISKYLESNGIIINKKIPRGDAGISFGQVIYFLYK